MPRFFTDVGNITSDTVNITGSDARHIALSLRMRVGDELTVCDFSRREYKCMLSCVSPSQVTAKIISSSISDTEPPYYAKLYQALPKGERADMIVQKSVECGVSEIVFFLSERCVARVDTQGAEKKLARWRKISEEAAKQCGRGIIPEVKFILDFASAVADASEGELSLICYEGDGANGVQTRNIGVILDEYCNEYGNNRIPHDIRFVVGSEGGFSLSEAESAHRAGLVLAGLGKRILRCETAAPFMLTCLSMRYELS